MEITSALGGMKEAPKRERPLIGEIHLHKRSKRRRSEKVSRYKSCQILYANDVGKNHMDGKENVKCTITMKDFYLPFRSGYFQVGRRSRQQWVLKTHPAKGIHGEPDQNEKRHSPGPDGITKRNLLNWDRNGTLLAKEYTRWLVQGIIPQVVKECRTRLLPKSPNSEDLRDISNWRPVTIGSALLRLFGRIMTMSLAHACPIDPRQRGFFAESDGCAENLMIVDRLIGRSGSEKRPLAAVFVEFTKAFDLVSHEHILCALKQHILELIRNSYVDCSTRIGCGKAVSGSIHKNVGGKQGDPMSPMLFNLAMDPLIHSLETAKWGLEWGE